MAASRGGRSFLVVALSARVLAQSAHRAGLPVTTLDLFNDLDTARCALAGAAVAPRRGARPGFDRADLLRLAGRLAPPQRCEGLVYGAGFESDPDLLDELAQGRALLGNPPALVRRLKDPFGFFGLLDRLGIAFPEWSATMPPRPGRWLYKRRGGTGGRHVVDAASLQQAPADGAGYFQRRCGGRPHSLLVLADGRNAQVAGISLQLTAGAGPHRHAYRGALGPVDLPRAVRARLHRAAEALVEATGLVGANSIDFMLDGEREFVLEVNPRPPATLGLYDPDWPRGLFEAHVQACRGGLAARLPGADRRRVQRKAGTVRGHAIVYNAGLRAITAPQQLPSWCGDLPRGGSRIPAGAPICTVHAEAPEAGAVRRRLARRAALLKGNLKLQAGEEIRDGGK